MPEALLTLEGVHTYIAQYHILQGVSFAVPEGGITVLLGRNGAGKTTCLRTIMGLWRASQGRITLRRREHRRARHADHRAARHRLRAGEHGALHGPHRGGESGAGGALGPHRCGAARVAVRPVPAHQDVLDAAGRQSVGRPEADAVDRARADRAAPADPDRRADQGPGAGHHQVHDGGHRRAQAHQHHHPAGGAELRHGAVRSAIRWR